MASMVVSPRRESLSTLKHRFTYGVEAPKGSTYFGLSPSLAATDSTVVACSATHWAIPYSGGGGPIYVSSFSSKGKVEPGCSVLNTHKGAVQDITFSPFHENLMVAASLDCTMSVWDVAGPAEAAPLSMIATREFTMHFSDISAGREVGALTLSASSGACSESVVNNVAFSYDGCVLAVTCKDKCLRMIDPRVSTGATVVATLSNSQALGRNSRVAWLSSQSGGSALLTCGGLPNGQRVLSLWDARKAEVVLTRTVDTNSGQLYPLLDEGTGLCFLVGKGDTVVKLYETMFMDPSVGGKGISQLEKSTEFQTSLEPFAGVCMLPKKCCDVRSVESARLLKLTSDSVVPISFFTPRSDALKGYFQDDLFPPVRSHIIEKSPTMEDFFSGAAAGVFFPRFESLQPEGLLPLSQRPEAESRRPSVSRSEEFREKQAAEAAASRLREEDFRRLQALAIQNAAHNPNLSMDGGGADVEEYEWN